MQAQNGSLSGQGAALQELPILELLPADARALVANSFVPATFPFGGVMTREGDEADALYLLVSGRARVLKRGDGGEEVPLSFLKPGDTFGEVPLLTGRYVVTVAGSRTDGVQVYDWHTDALAFDVSGPFEQDGPVDLGAEITVQ